MRKLNIVVLALGVMFACFTAESALVLDVNPNQSGDWVLHLTGSHNGSGLNFVDNTSNNSIWNSEQGGSLTAYTLDEIWPFTFGSAPVNTAIVDAFDVGDGTVVGGANLKGFYIFSSGLYLKFDSSFGTSISDFTSATFDEAVILKPLDKNSFSTVWNDGTYSDGDFTMNVSSDVIPEPAALGLMSFTSTGIFLLRALRRRKLAGLSLIPVREYECDMFESREISSCSDELDDYTITIQRMVKAHLVVAWCNLHDHYQTLSKTFWNHMVVRHERRIARKKAFKATFKKTSLAYFDAFLALIMK